MAYEGMHALDQMMQFLFWEKMLRDYWRAVIFCGSPPFSASTLFVNCQIWKVKGDRRVMGFWTAFSVKEV